MRSDSDAARILCVMLLAGLSAARLAPAAERGALPAASAPPWTSVGSGGGGAMFYPAGSPHDPNLMFVSSDMGGFYRSDDGGKSWRMLDWRMIRHSRTPVFHPTDPHTIFAPDYAGDRLRVSRDRGLTWQPLAENPAWKGDRVLALSIDRGRPALMLLSGEKGLYRSEDGGTNWSAVGAAPTGLIGMHIDQTSPPERRVCIAASPQAAYRSEDGGLTWREASSGLPWREIRAFCGGSDAASGRAIVYCAIPSKAVNGHFAGGVYRSRDGGRTWEPAMGPGINTELGQKDQYGAGDIDQFFFLAQAENRPETVYVTNLGTGYHPPYHYTAYLSDDAGTTWRACLFNDPRFKAYNTEVGWLTYDRSRGFGGNALGFGVNAGNADEAFYSNYGELFVTTDGGGRWRQVFTRRADEAPKPGKLQHWASIGLEDTTCWRYVCDPHQSNRAYICYTDIGFARSDDRGASWSSAIEGMPWCNTVYQLTPDPEVPGRLYAACSSQHDIPHWMYVQGPIAAGGVCRSDDFARNWVPLSKGLPEAPVTSIMVDPSSPTSLRVLYAAVYGHGVYKSVDSGASWTKKAQGIEPEQNRQVYSLQRRKDGTLFCTVAGRRKGRGVDRDLAGGLFMSGDGAETWKKISSPEMFRTVDFALDPVDRNVIYVAAMDGMGHTGGVYKTEDGGATWRLLNVQYDRAVCGFIEGFGVQIHPKDRKTLYFLTNTHGMFLSRDAGETWAEIRAPKCPPFMNCQRITWDPCDIRTVYIVTFGGGVWKGPDPAL